MTKVHLGCNKRDFGPEWDHIDIIAAPHIDSHDITMKGYADNSVDIIYSSHLIAYFDRTEIIPLLGGWYNKLKPNGILRLATPDFEAMAKLYVNNKWGINSLLGPLYGKMEIGNQPHYHKTVWDFNSLNHVLVNTCFTNIKRYDWKTTPPHDKIDDHSQAYIPHMDKENGILISLNIEAIK